MKYNTGEEFLNKLYKDLHLQKEVMHTATSKDKTMEKIGKYMDRLDRVHEKAKTKKQKQRVLDLYYDKYVVKRELLSDYSKETQDNIINAQKESLKKWIDYLTDENAKYPMWAKYWVFQGMLKIGTYNEQNDTYRKRSNKTLAPFIECNPEIIAKTISLIRESVEENKISDENLKQLIKNGNFEKLYTLLKNKSKKTKLINSGTEGIWVKYNEGSIEDAKKLYDSLQGYGTEWCTAGDFNTAKSQICGGKDYNGGDFYVYYTKDKTNAYKIPRIAIRMDGIDEIGEIRGVANSQNLEKGLEYIVEQKLNEMTFLNDKTKQKYLQAIQDMRMLTVLNRKIYNKEDLTKDEQRFIFEIDKNIQGFGYQKDKRIDYIKSNTFITNKSIILETVRKDESTLKYASEELKGDKEVVLEAVRNNGDVLKYASEELKKDKEVVLEAVRNNGIAFFSASKELKKDIEVVLEAVRKGVSGALKYASETLRNDKEFVLEAVRNNGDALDFASENLQNDKEIVLEAVRNVVRAMEYASKELKGDKEVVLEIVRNVGYALAWVNEELQGDKEVVLEAVRNDGRALKFASEELEKDKEVVLEAVRNDGIAFFSASKELKKDKEVVLEAVRNYGYVLKYVSEELKGDKEIVLEAVRNNGFILEYVNEEFKRDKEVVLEAVRNDERALKFASEELKGDKEVVLEAVRKDGYALAWVNKELKGDKEVVLEAVRNDERALKFASEELQNDEEIVRVANGEHYHR